MQLFAKKKIQVNDIAYLSFLDVANFYSCEFTMQMRYNDVTKNYLILVKSGSMANSSVSLGMH